MILFTILLVTILLLLGVVILGAGAFGAGVILLFGDVIVCIFILIWLIKIFVFRKK